MKKKKIPDFKTEDEEREFWATHDSTEYEMEDDAEVTIPANPLAQLNQLHLDYQQRCSLICRK